MDLAFNAEELAFQKEVRDWITANMPPEVAEESRRSRTSHVSKERLLQWQKKLAGKGWLCPNWPKEYGGPGWNSTQKFIFEMEMARAEFALSLVVQHQDGGARPDEVRQRRAEEALPAQDRRAPRSCGARAIPSRARAPTSRACAPRRNVQGDHYVVNGQKIWTTNAHLADWIFCLVRTSNEGKRQEGISFLLIDMKSPGIKIDPIYLVDGTRTPMRHEVNQVFFTDVKVPVENRVGEENKGWTYAKYLLEFERGGQAHRAAPAQGVPPSAGRCPRRQLDAGEPLSANPQLAREDGGAGDGDRRRRDERADVLLEPEDRRRAGQHGLDRQDARHRGRPEGHRARRRGGRLVRRALHRAAQLRQQRRPGRRRVCRRRLAALLQHRKTTIYGGSSEVQRNVLAKAMLGL